MNRTMNTSANAAAPHADGAPVALQCRALSAVLGQGAQAHTALHGVDVCLAAGRWTSIVGPNGAGKSTLLRALAGLQAVQGTVELFGRPLPHWGARERARTLAWLAQGGAASQNAADDLTAYDVAMLGRLPHQGWLAAPSAADRAAVERALRQTQAWASTASRRASNTRWRSPPDRPPKGRWRQSQAWVWRKARSTAARSAALGAASQP